MRTLALPLGERAAFTGVDRRQLGGSANPNSMFEAENMDLTPGGAWKRRDALRILCKLPRHTFGLYTANDQLRVAVPAGHGIEFQIPPPLAADVFGKGTATPTPVDHYARVSAASFFSRDQNNNPFMFLVLESSQAVDPNIRIYEHHYINQFPTVMGAPRKTLVEQTFQPGPALYKYQGKLYAPGRIDDLVHYSSTVNGPTDWTAPDDAGAFAPGQHTGGASELQGFTQYEGLLGAVYPNAIQFWRLDPDPNQMLWVKTYEGPGTNMFGSLATVTGDTFYFSEGGFRSLVTQLQSGERREGDLGAPIFPISRLYRSYDPRYVRAIWSPARSQYLCFFGDPDEGTTRVFAYTLSPESGVTGWSFWDLPVMVDDVVELEGVLYIRSGDFILYMLEKQNEDEMLDGTFQAFSGVLESQYVHGGDLRPYKEWNTVDYTAEGEASVYLLPDPTDRSIREVVGVGIVGSTIGDDPILLDVTSQTMALRFEATSHFELYNMAIRHNRLSGSR